MLAHVPNSHFEDGSGCSGVLSAALQFPIRRVVNVKAAFWLQQHLPLRSTREPAAAFRKECGMVYESAAALVSDVTTAGRGNMCTGYKQRC